MVGGRLSHDGPAPSQLLLVMHTRCLGVPVPWGGVTALQDMVMESEPSLLGTAWEQGELLGQEVGGGGVGTESELRK